MTHPHPESLDAAAQYLLTREGDTLPEDQRAQLDRVRKLLADEAIWSRPPPELIDEIFARLAPMPVTMPSHQIKWPWLTTLAGVAAAVLLVASLGVARLSSAGDDDSVAAVALVGTDLAPGASATAAVQDTSTGLSISLHVEGLAPSGEGFYYQAWVNGPSGTVAIGTFHLQDPDSDPVELWSGVDAVDYPELTVTIEPEDGDPGSSGHRVLVGVLR